MSEPQAYEFRVSIALTASAEYTVIATSEEEARAEVAEQLNLRTSSLTGEIAQSASIQIRKELGADEFDVDLEEVREPSDDELDGGGDGTWEGPEGDDE